MQLRRGQTVVASARHASPGNSLFRAAGLQGRRTPSSHHIYIPQKKLSAAGAVAHRTRHDRSRWQLP